MVGDTILIKDISINGNNNLTNADQLSKTLTDNTINALGIDASSRTIWINGQPYGNTYVNIKKDDTLENPIGGEIFNDFANNVASGEYSHAEGKGTIATNEGEHASGKYNKSNTKTIHSVGIGTSDDDRKNAEEIHYDSGDKYVIGIGGYDGTNSQTDGVKTVQAVVNESINQITISYLKLKELRDASQLVPGKEYRINDYTCTTTQTGTRSAGNDFDIIVTADSESTLNEEARAINHEFDNPEQDHFKDCNLAAWKLWYCLDNDTNRFAWADTNTNADNNENGKGVIYRMIDEFNNECPYDFKNIQFYRAWDDSLVSWSIIPDETTTTSIKPCYTFSSAEYGSITSSTSEFIDASLKESNRVYSNIIKSFTKAVWPVRQKQFLNNNCLFYTNTYSNTLGTNCYNNTFIDCSFNILENGCYNNLLNRGIYNTLKTYCYNNVLHNNSSYNTLGNNCYNNRIDCGNYNRFGDDCYDNALINDCNTNTFGNSCYSNNFLDDCTQNYFGNGCYENSFSFRAVNNSFGNNCYNNTFGQDCSDNALGNNCNNNAFGDNCSNSAFGNSCNNIKFGTISSTGVTYTYDYYQNNHFGDNCQYIVFKGEERASQTAQVQNYNFAQGLQGTETEYLSIDGTRGRKYDTYISLNTDGTLKESVIADKLDKMIEISYKELYDLREASGLIPGQQYRITDYICTTNPADTSIRAQQNKFDIIVTADSESTLNEEARAIRNDNDNNYFKDCDLNAWKLWYCLDNDTSRFAWADETETGGKPNGRGVIYRMIDEWNNDVPYDFKNIQFKRYAVTDITSTILTTDALNNLKKNLVKDSNGGLYFATKDSYGNFVPSDVEDGISYQIDEKDSNWYYTFQGISSDDGSTISKMYDLTVETFKLTDECISSLEIVRSGADTEDYCRENKIEQLNQEYFVDYIYYKGRQILNNIVFIGGLNYCYQNNDSWEYKTSSIYGNRFGVNCNSNTFGNDCYSNTFGSGCYSNTFGNDCYSNTFGNDCYSNTFGRRCYSNTFGNDCYSNTFGGGCYSNTFESRCYSNTFERGCYSNTFESRCYSNTFGSDCYSNTFESDCNGNIFGSGCYSNTFGSGCYSNTFGNDCDSNTVGNNCNNIKFTLGSSASTKYNYYQNNHFGDGCQSIVFKQDEDTDPLNIKYVQNYTFAQGFGNHTIKGERGREYDTYISLNTDGTVKESVIADKLDKMIEITYKELYDLRETNGLIPGQHYRITDYTCTTIQENTRSAGHDFDIIVTADSKNKLNEEARAIQHTELDVDYFAKCNLSAWKIWYCLDNDTNRFGWALGDERFLGITFSNTGSSYYVSYKENKVINGVEYALWYKDESHYIGTTTLAIDEFCTLFEKRGDVLSEVTIGGDIYISDNTNVGGGKGVIYRMIDEFGNDCPYDFKNIQFKRYAITNIQSDEIGSTELQDGLRRQFVVSLNGGLYFGTTHLDDSHVPSNGSANINYTMDTADSVWYYTFQGFSGDNFSTVTKQYDLSVESFKLPQDCIDYLNTRNYPPDFEEYCKDNVINPLFQETDKKQLYYKGRQSLNNIVFIGGISYCFKDDLDQWVYKMAAVYGNQFGINCYSNTIGNDCYYNTFGNNCTFNTFGKSCWCNTFGNRCSNNTFGYGCYYNNFLDLCHHNTFVYNCTYTSFRNGCDHNTIGFESKCNTFENGCSYIKFTKLSSDRIPDKTTIQYNYNHFGNGCKYILFNANYNPNNTNNITVNVQNYNFAQGLQGSWSTYITVKGISNRSYETSVSEASEQHDGNAIFAYCLAEVVVSVAKEKAEPITRVTEL